MVTMFVYGILWRIMRVLGGFSGRFHCRVCAFFAVFFYLFLVIFIVYQPAIIYYSHPIVKKFPIRSSPNLDQNQQQNKSPKKYMQKILRSFTTTKNLQDIIKNYTHITGCDRTKQIFQQAYLSATDYHNGEHYSRLTDLVSFATAKMMYMRMEEHETGRRILKEKPRITDEVYRGLGLLEDGTFGKQYYKFMNGLNFKPSQRPVVKYIPDLEYAYVLQRYKQIHDFLHVLLAKQITVDEELVLKWFQMRQLQLPSATLASLVSPLLSAKFSLSQISNVIRIADRAQFVMNIYFQEEFGSPADFVRKKYQFQ